MNNINAVAKPIQAGQVSDLSAKKSSSKNDETDSKIDKKKDSSDVSVNKMSQRLNANSTTTDSPVKEIADPKDAVSQVASGEAGLVAAQSGHITMEFVQSLLNKSPYEQNNIT